MAKLLTEEQRERVRLCSRRWYESLTPEQKKERFELGCARRREKGYTDEERRKKNEYAKTKRANFTEEERAAYRSKGREATRKSRQKLGKKSYVRTDEQRARHNAYARENRTYTDEQKKRRAIYMKDYARKRRELHHASELVRKYGITIDEYTRMLNEQGGVCYLCSGTNEDGSKLFVDHCHKTGVVRALLCRLCNLGLGSMRDDPALMRRAADLVEKWASVA